MGCYLYLFGASVFCLLLASFEIALFIHLYQSPEFETRNYGLLPMFGGTAGLLIYVFYKLIKRSPALLVDEYSIAVNGKTTYQWSELEKIALTGKSPFCFFTKRKR